MQSILLFVALAATFIFGFFVVRALEHFLDENRIFPEQEPPTGFSADEVEKQDGK